MSYTINNIVSTIFSRADRNKNGMIDVPGVAGATGRNESVLGTRDRMVLSIGARAANLPLTTSLIPLIVGQANTNTADGLTRDELTAYLRRFDTNGNSALDKDEIRAAVRQVTA